MGAGENQGLAGGAIVLGYGLMGALALTFTAGLLIMNLETKKVVRLNKIGALLILLFAIYVVIRLVFFTETQPPASPQKLKPTQPASDAVSYFDSEDAHMGLGFFSPKIHSLKPLYFYGNLTPGKELYEHTPWDSLTFVQKEMDQFKISYAPPIINPAHMKMDYEILLFRVVRLGKHFAEIKLSEHTGQTAIVDLHSGNLILWPEFLVNVYSLEVDNPDIRIKPLDHASGLTIPKTTSFYNPVSIKNNWIEVSCTDHNLREVGRGWIKWRDGNRLLVRYSLLS